MGFPRKFLIKYRTLANKTQYAKQMTACNVDEVRVRFHDCFPKNNYLIITIVPM